MRTDASMLYFCKLICFSFMSYATLMINYRLAAAWYEFNFNEIADKQ